LEPVGDVPTLVGEGVVGAVDELLSPDESRVALPFEGRAFAELGGGVEGSGFVSGYGDPTGHEVGDGVGV
jgi:hypothetical protein